MSGWWWDTRKKGRRPVPIGVTPLCCLESDHSQQFPIREDGTPAQCIRSWGFPFLQKEETGSPWEVREFPSQPLQACHLSPGVDWNIGGEGILRLGFWPSLTPDTCRRNTCQPPIAQRLDRQHLFIKSTSMKMVLSSHFHVPQKAERNFLCWSLGDRLLTRKTLYSGRKQPDAGFPIWATTHSRMKEGKSSKDCHFSDIPGCGCLR